MNHQIFERKWRSGAFSTGACLVQTRLQQTHTQPIRGVRAWTMGVTQQAVGLSSNASHRPVNRPHTAGDRLDVTQVISSLLHHPRGLLFATQLSR